MSTQTTQSKGQAESFAEHLEKLFVAEDRAALAALRRGLGKRAGEASEMHRYVLPYLHNVTRRQENACYIVAALFGLHPSRNWKCADGDSGYVNLGASLREFAGKDTKSAEEMQRNLERVGRRFVALLNSHEEDLPEHLRQIVSLLRTKDAPINWAQLIHDITFWSDDKRRVQVNWARAFWRAESGTWIANEATPAAANESES